ncbi:MAG: SCO family protein, partial [Gammaproteobacteria bacterium]|nr:SCO family protein [Gammaproteobacteria bacterium]NNL51529.1 SCO family protein [Woeseiaceae bacterium]
GPDSDQIAFVMISVDGERDTPEVMKRFLERYSPTFIGLTGERGVVKALASEFSAAFFKGNAIDKSGAYTVSHSPQVFLVDQDGRLRAEFYNAAVDAMNGTVQALLAEAGISQTSD